ncbi:MAG: AarF/ABC1/UbiB kinase family protein [Planctomycetes bacterium]|nr:AarF/ABC1/UbiB kinase family protein [Planctomycetota bacterium]
MKITTIPNVYRNVNRWGEILTTLSKYGLAGWVGRFELPLVKGFLKNRDGEALAHLSRETRIRLALEELGPTFIKLGQILSTRPDQVGMGLAQELQKLQTSVACDKPQVVRETIEEELERPLDELFQDFDPTPLASASIGQAHRARLHSGEHVVVKVQHAGIRRRMEIDLDILAGLAQLADKLPELQPYRPQATVAEFRRVVRRELDFAREARNLEQFARNFAGNRHVRIPQLYPKLSTSRVLTMEWLDGAKLSDPAVRHLPNVDLSKVTRYGADMYLEMIFHHGFYHGDPHPGNLVVLPDNAIGLLDFGMVGRLDEQLREDIEDMLGAIVTQDSQQLTSLVMRLGAAPPGLDEPALSVDLSEFVVHYANQPIDSFDLAGALTEMIEIVQRYRIALPSSLAMLIKVLVMLDGTVRMLEPTFSLMELIQPYQKKMLRRRLSPARQMRKMRRIYSEIELLAEVLPRRLRDILQQVESGKFDVHLDHRGLEPSVNRLVLGMMTSALFLGSSLLISRTVWPIFGVSVPGTLGMILSAFLGWRLHRAITKSGRLDRKK